jgi:hypothetical protein
VWRQAQVHISTIASPAEPIEGSPTVSADVILLVARACDRGRRALGGRRNFGCLARITSIGKISGRIAIYGIASTTIDATRYLRRRVVRLRH